MFEGLRYRREFEVLSPFQRNQQFQAIINSIPVNPFSSDVEDFSETRRFVERNNKQLGLESLDTISPAELYKLHLIMLQDQRLASPELKITFQKLSSLLKFAKVSSHFKGHIVKTISTYSVIGIYDNPVNSTSDEVEESVLEWAEFKRLLFEGSDEAGIFNSKVGLDIEKEVFIHERGRLGNFIVNLWSQGVDTERALGHYKRSIDAWERSFTKYHKVEP